MSYTVRKKAVLRFSRLVLIIIGIYVMIGAALYFLQEKFLFRPSVLPQDHVYQFTYDHEELFLNTSEDAVINAIHFTVDRPQGVLLYFHGNAGDLQRWGEVCEFFVAMDYDVLVMDYRTYGKSKGRLNESALYNDGQKCYNYLLQRYAEEDISIYGRSLGASIASKIAATNQPKQLILESPFYSLADVAQERFPIMPVKKLLRYELPNYKHIQKVNCPISIFHGTDDYVVPFASGEKLSKEKPSNFIPIEKGGHNDLITFEAYRSAVTDLLKN